jgi:hypothetical protein
MLMIKVPMATATAAILFFLISPGNIFPLIVHIIAAHEAKIPRMSITENAAPIEYEIFFARYNVGIARDDEFSAFSKMAVFIIAMEIISAIAPKNAPSCMDLLLSAFTPRAV